MKKTLKLMSMVCVLLLAACAPNPTVSVTPTANAPTQAASATPEPQVIEGYVPEWSYKFTKEVNEMNYDYSTTEQYVPFWHTNIIYNECCCFTQRDDGSITARLAFTPGEIISVRDWTLKNELVEGVDYTFDSATNTFTRPEGSSVPYFTQNFLHGKNEDGSLIDAFTAYDKEPWSTLGYARYGNAIYCIGAPLYEKQMFITYSYSKDDFKGPVTAYQGERLQKTMEKLKNKEKINIVFFGDSIPVGCDASSMYNREPRQRDFPHLFKKALEDIYDCKTTLKNTAVGGTTSGWAKETIKENVLDNNPDLLVLMTGGNDGDNNIATTKANVYATVLKVREALPDCDIILMDTFVGNKDGGWDGPGLKPPMGDAFDDIAAEFETGVASARIHDMHTYMLQYKDYIDFSGNGINHPNDYMIRLYAQQLLSCIVDFGALATK